MRALIRALWEREIDPIHERYRWLVSLFAIIFIVSFSLQFTTLMHHLAFLGPGLGEEPSTDILNRLIFDRLTGPNAFYGWVLGVFLLSVIVFRGWVMFWSYFGYQKSFGEKFPIHIVVLFLTVNAIGALSIPLVLFIIGFIMLTLGFDFNDGWLLIENTVSACHQWVMNYVPTIIQVPAPLALIIVFMLAGFVHYWLHRLGHESRVLWLLFHRHHHMSTHLCQFSTVAVFFAFPLFIVFVLPYTVIFAALSKLVYAEPLYVEIFILNCFVLIPEIFGHSDVFYEKVNRKLWVKWSSFILGNGIYHYLHHSADITDSYTVSKHGKRAVHHVNMVNLGGGFCFIWDKVFGTFTPLRDKKPRVGLTGSPALYMNPLRLAMSGVAQIGFELKMNKSWVDRFWVIFGSSSYTPKVSRDFAVKC